MTVLKKSPHELVADRCREKELHKATIVLRDHTGNEFTVPERSKAAQFLAELLLQERDVEEYIVEEILKSFHDALCYDVSSDIREICTTALIEKIKGFHHHGGK